MAKGPKKGRQEADSEADSEAAAAERTAETRRRLSTTFGWIAGGAAGLLVNYGIMLATGEGYPTTYTTFGLFLLGAFGGMALSDRLGPRGFRPLGIAAGILLAIVVILVVAFMMVPSRA